MSLEVGHRSIKSALLMILVFILEYEVFAFFVKQEDLYDRSFLRPFCSVIGFLAVLALTYMLVMKKKRKKIGNLFFRVIDFFLVFVLILWATFNFKVIYSFSDIVLGSIVIIAFKVVANVLIKKSFFSKQKKEVLE
jgi:amino acid transporter